MSAATISESEMVAAAAAAGIGRKDMLSVPIPGCIARRQSLTILSEEGFANAGVMLAEFDECSQWMWGDYLLFAEKHGLRSVLDSARRNLHTSTIYAYVDTARFFPPKDRFAELYFNHHSAAMYILGKHSGLAEAKKWLHRAVAKKWTVGELREAMRSAERSREGDPGPQRGVVRITDFAKVSRFCSTVRPDELADSEADELRRVTRPLFDFLCGLHRGKFAIPAQAS